MSLSCLRCLRLRRLDLHQRQLQQHHLLLEPAELQPWSPLSALQGSRRGQARTMSGAILGCRVGFQSNMLGSRYSRRARRELRREQCHSRQWQGISKKDQLLLLLPARSECLRPRRWADLPSITMRQYLQLARLFVFSPSSCNRALLYPFRPMPSDSLVIFHIIHKHCFCCAYVFFCHSVAIRAWFQGSSLRNDLQLAYCICEIHRSWPTCFEIL